MSKNFLSMDEELQKGDFLLSNNGEYKAIFQEDGNFVVYGWKPVWASNTNGQTNAKRLIMQEDCNCVMYTDDTVLWHTNTHNSNVKRCRLTLRNDGRLFVENDGAVVWKSTKWS
ncbi:B-type lectin plumieribetin-like [Tachysurus vachellii]|uniref:B-type lectin plumieribetin-like n=1 Tax=Tachysurus vachellii TaxID=175792 RepID=UPI00296B3CC9|nr:B-type lectin plumieribetin-like [Tachysurus vachellii]